MTWNVTCNILYENVTHGKHYSLLSNIMEVMKKNKEVMDMLKLTIKPGEYINIGNDIKVIFSGGSANNMHILVDAPREYNIVRNRVLERNAKTEEEKRNLKTYYKEAGLSQEAKEQIKKIIVKDKKSQKGNAALEEAKMSEQ